MVPVRRVVGLVLAAGLAVGVVACVREPDDAPLPAGVEAHLDQSRVLRKTRTVFVRVHNGSGKDLTVEQFRLTSPRFEPVEWEGREVVGAGYDADLEVTLPVGRCGGALDARLTVETRSDGEHRRSTLPLDDVYGAVTAIVDRDCAQVSVSEAATVEIDEVRIVGEGRDAVLELPVTFTPTGRRTDVALEGFGPTVLFTAAPDAPPVGEHLLAGTPFTVDLRLVPNRCDPHALAEDKVGTLIPVLVSGRGLPDDASYFLPLGDRRRGAFFDYYAEACGLAP